MTSWWLRGAICARRAQSSVPSVSRVIELRALPGGGGADDARIATRLLDAGVLVLEP